MEHETCNTKSKSRAYCFTINNYTDEEIGTLEQEFTLAVDYAMQEEVGKEGVTHLQGFIRYKNPRSFASMKKLCPRAHWEKTRSCKASKLYCSKEDTRNGKQWIKPKELACKDPLEGLDMYDFQTEIIERVKEEPNDRTIMWYWEKNGNVGKTTLAKHICLHYNAIYLSGKASDMKYAIAQMKEKPKIVIMDLTRSVEDYVSYEGIESIKNGIFFSGKYEGGMVMYDPPHVLILSNFPPDQSKLSIDRWDVTEL